jgi:hypothetical protein
MEPTLKMKNKFPLICALCSLLFASFPSARAQTLWDKRINLGRNETANALIQSSDGGYLLVGSINEPNSALQDILVVKTNASGDTLWTRIFPGVYSESATCLAASSDGGYFVGGNVQVTVPNIPVQTDWMLMKLTASGDTAWTRTLRYPANDQLFRLMPDGSGGVIAAGYRDIAGYAIGAYSRYSETGVLTQNSNFTGITAIIQDGFLDDAGRLFLAGSSFSQTHDFTIFEFPIGGTNPIFHRLPMAPMAEYASRINPLADGGYIVSGAGGFNQNMKPLLVRVDQNFDTVWTRRWSDLAAPTHSQTYGARSVVNTQGQIYMSFTDNAPGGDLQGRFMTVSPTGELTRSFLFGFSGADLIFDLILNENQQPVVCGTTIEPSGTNSDIWLSLPDPNFVTGVSNPTPVRTDLLLHPNPASAYLSWPGMEEAGPVAIWDNMGKAVDVVQPLQHGLDIRHLPSGLYQLQAKTPGGWKQARFRKD